MNLERNTQYHTWQKTGPYPVHHCLNQGGTGVYVKADANLQMYKMIYQQKVDGADGGTIPWNSHACIRFGSASGTILPAHLSMTFSCTVYVCLLVRGWFPEDGVEHS